MEWKNIIKFEYKSKSEWVKNEYINWLIGGDTIKVSKQIIH